MKHVIKIHDIESMEIEESYEEFRDKLAKALKDNKKLTLPKKVCNSLPQENSPPGSGFSNLNPRSSQIFQRRQMNKKKSVKFIIPE